MSDCRPKNREWEPAFRYLYERNGEIKRSAELVGVTPRAVNRLRRRDPRFDDWIRSVRESRRRRLLDRVR